MQYSDIVFLKYVENIYFKNKEFLLSVFLRIFSELYVQSFVRVNHGF